jgi:hypothetical protein
MAGGRAPVRIGGAALLLLCATALGLMAPRAAAQQFVTDDATIVAPDACQLEAWHGRTASWILPACQFIPGVELTAGVGFEAHGDHRDPEYLLQGKGLLYAPADGAVWAGLVAGLSFEPEARPLGDGPAAVYAYVPVTLTAAGGNLVLHLNGGWIMERDDPVGAATVADESPHALTWGVAAEVPVAGPLTAMAELFGEGRHRPGYTLGVNVEVQPERLTFDVTWGGHTAAGVPGSGWTLGGAWTPPPLTRGARREGSPRATPRKGR